MASTTIRVDQQTHERLRRISAELGWQIIDVVRLATDALERQRFIERVNHDAEALAADADRLASYLTDAESTHVTDGIA